MEYLTKIIENAAEQEGGKALLALKLDVSRTNISDVLAGKRALPIEACLKLKELTGADLERLIVENEAITAKKPEKVAYLKKKLVEFESMAACLILACVTSVVTPTPSQAAPLSQVVDSTLYIMSNMIARS